MTAVEHHNHLERVLKREREATFRFIRKAMKLEADKRALRKALREIKKLTSSQAIFDIAEKALGK